MTDFVKDQGLIYQKIIMKNSGLIFLNKCARERFRKSMIDIFNICQKDWGSAIWDIQDVIEEEEDMIDN